MSKNLVELSFSDKKRGMRGRVLSKQLELTQEEKGILRRYFKNLEYEFSLYGVAPFTVRVYQGGGSDCHISFTYSGVFFHCVHCEFGQPAKSNIDRFILAVNCFMRMAAAVKLAKFNRDYSPREVNQYVSLYLLEHVCELWLGASPKESEMEENFSRLGYNILLSTDKQGRKYLIKGDKGIYAWISRQPPHWRLCVATAGKYRPVDVYNTYRKYHFILSKAGYSIDPMWGAHHTENQGIRAKAEGKQVYGLQTKYVLEGQE